MEPAISHLPVVVPRPDGQDSLDEPHRRASAVCHEAVGADREIVPHRGCPEGDPAVMGVTACVGWGVASPLGPLPAEPAPVPCGFAAGHALTRSPVSRAA